MTFDPTALEIETVAETIPQRFTLERYPCCSALWDRIKSLSSFLAGIPDFYWPKRVRPNPGPPNPQYHRLPRAIVSFMDRSLTSDLISGITEQRRIRVVLKAIETDLHLLQRTFYHALCVVESTVFQCVEFVHLAMGGPMVEMRTSASSQSA